MEYDFYKEQLNILNKDAPTINIQLTDYDGNKTKCLGVNKESLTDIIDFLNDYVNNKGDLK